MSGVPVGPHPAGITRKDFANPPAEELSFAENLVRRCFVCESGTYNPEMVAWMVHDFVEAQCNEELRRRQEVEAELRQVRTALDLLATAVGNCLLCPLNCLDEDDHEDDPWRCPANIGDEGPECAEKIKRWAIAKAQEGGIKRPDG